MRNRWECRCFAPCADDISDDNADDSRASLHPQLHHATTSIVPGHAVRPCLRISRLGFESFGRTL
jgi:hypothetical protein